MSYSEFMVVGIDQGVSCCNECGALVPNDRIGRHSDWHETLIRMLAGQESVR